MYLDSDVFNQEGRPGKGDIPADYALVGIAPSMNRPKERDNEPFGAASWKVLKAIISEAPGTIYITNLIKTPLPASKKPPKRLVQAYTHSLIRELKLVAPRRVLAIGSVPSAVLCPGYQNLNEDHGTQFFNPELNAIIVPTYHFSAVARDPSKRRVLARDLERFFTLPDPIPAQHQVIHDWAQVRVKYGGKLFLDIETTGLSVREDKITLVGVVSDQDNLVSIFPNPTQFDLIGLKQFIDENDLIVVGHNLQFDLEWLMHSTNTYWSVKVHDTMSMAHIAGQTPLSLKHLTTMMTDRPGSRAFGSYDSLDYLTEDVLSTKEIYSVFDGVTNESYARNLVERVIPRVAGMRRRGVYIDRSRLEDIGSQVTTSLEEVGQELAKASGVEINWKSSTQVRDLLLSKGVELTETTKTGKPSVKETVLLKLAPTNPLVAQILKYREVDKMRTFVESYAGKTSDVDPCLHPRMLLASTDTGRTSMKDPNLQQVTRTGPLKLLFISRWEGGLMGLIDLSQAELRVAALLSNDRKFADALRSGDPHRINGAIVYKVPESEVTPFQRKKSKGVTFGVLYGGGPTGLAAKVGCSVEEVAMIRDILFDTYKDLARYVKRTRRFGAENGYINTIFGRHRDLRDLIEKEGPHSAERKAINTPIQSVASDIALFILDTVSTLLRDRGLHSRVLFGVHDSNLIEIYPGEMERVAQIVQHAFTMLDQTPLSELGLWGYLPLVGELVIGNSWASIESTNENYSPLTSYPCSSNPELPSGELPWEPVDTIYDEFDQDEETEDDDDTDEVE